MRSLEEEKRKFHQLIHPWVVPSVIFASISLLAAWFGHHQSKGLPEENVVWYSVLPPLFAIVVAISTRRLFVSFGCSILLGLTLSSFLTAEQAGLGSWTQAFVNQSAQIIDNTIGTSLSGQSVSLFNGQVIIFVILILSMISVLMVAGGLQGIVQSISILVSGRRSAQLVTVLSGLVVFIDDYANTMIVGSTMRPLTDHQKISREKLAFLVDATTAPIAGVAFISTWIGFELWLFSSVSETLGIDRDSYTMFLDALPFRFYCFIMIIFVLINAITGRDFGPMRKAEERAVISGQLFAEDAVLMTSQDLSNLNRQATTHISSLSAIIPLFSLFITIFIAFWVFSDSQNSIWSLNAWQIAISEVSAQEKNLTVLAIASGVGLLTAVFCAIAIARLDIGQITKALLYGLKSGLLPTAILLLAWMLKSVCDTLQTSEFLSQMIGGNVSPKWFPAIVFLLAALTSFTTGTSWGTMMLLIPIVVPISFSLEGGKYSLTTMICLGAVLDGSIFGDHCSPISDTTIMSSISSACDHLHHVRTQLPYSLVVALVALIVGYLPASLGLSPVISFVLAAILLFIVFRLIGSVPKTNHL